MNKVTEVPVSLLKYLIGKEYINRIESYERQYIEAVQLENAEYLRCHKRNCKTEIAESMGILCNVSPDTISSYGNYALRIDELMEKNQVLAMQILTGETKATIKDLRKLIDAL